MELFIQPMIIFFMKVIASLFLYYMVFGKMSIKAEDLNKPYAFRNLSKQKFNFKDILEINEKYSPMTDQCALRIYGGEKAVKGTIPYQVALRRGIQKGRRWVVFCGGSIITPIHVITAAHCFDSMGLRPTRVIAGTLISSVVLRGRNKKERLASLKVLQLTESWRKIAACYGHSKYSRKRIVNDFAILEIQKPFVFSSTVQPIPILTKRMEKKINIPDDTLCLVSGYGLLEHRQHSSVLRRVCVPTVPYKTCKRMYKLYSNRTQICAGSKGKDSCQGDSGGPMTCKGVLVGLVSFGGQCGEAPGVYTRITGYTASKNLKFASCSSDKIFYKIDSVLLLLALPRMYCLIIVFVSNYIF